MKKIVCFALLVVLMLTVGPQGALAARNQKVESVDFQNVLADESAKGAANVYHWWTAGGEKEAINAIISGMKERFPSVNAKDVGIPGGAGGSMVMKIKVLQQAGKPPEAFQAHPGLEIQPYLDAGMLLNLDELWEYAELETRMLGGIADLCRAGDGSYYIVPVGVHKTNTVFYNKRLLEQCGISMPAENPSWEDFWALCEECAQKLPQNVYPFDMGDRKGWPATQVFESIMMGTSVQTYEDFINGRATPDQVQPVLENFKSLLTYTAPDHNARDWYEAAGGMVAGDCAMMMMGTWMQPFLTSQGWTYGEDYGVFNVPGTEGYFGMCIDAFVVSNASSDVNAGVRWVYSASSPDVQSAFSRVKESVSPYLDTPDETYNALTLKYKNELAGGTLISYPSFTHGTALPWSASTDLHTRIQDFATQGDSDAARYAKMITDALKEAGVKGEWKIERK